MKQQICMWGYFLMLTIGTLGWAEDTNIIVRVKSKDAKFVGSSMGGVLITIRDVDTGQLLASGKTSGGTGDTERIMKKPKGRHGVWSDKSSAKFTTVIDLDEPRQVEIVAYGPLAQRQSAARSSITQWLIPGKDIVKGDAIMLELPGFVVDVQSPPAHIKLKGTPQTLHITANVTMMCGCPIKPKGIWDAEHYDVSAIIKKDGKRIAVLPLTYAGAASQFATDYVANEPGTYDVTVCAFDPDNGNAGVDKTTFVIKP